MQLQPIHLSSGNLIADRRFEWARDCEAKGDLAAAADLLVQALELAPDYAPAWFVLGELREKLGNRAGAIDAFAQAKAADPQDRHGAALHLVRLGAEPAVAMPESYVRTLFDGYAAGFDRALTEGLSYRAPELLFRAVAAAQTGPRMKFGSVLDLGCGTGLAALPFRPLSDWLVGVDLSPAMVAQAESKQLYDRLATGELAAFLKGELDKGERYDLVVAADVFVYVNDLAPVLAAATKTLAPGGVFAFTVETHPGEGVKLLQTLRYAHGEPYIRRALAGAGLSTASIAKAAVRSEKGVPVDSLVVIAVASTLPNVPVTFSG